MGDRPNPLLTVSYTQFSKLGARNLVQVISDEAKGLFAPGFLHPVLEKPGANN